MDKVVIKYHDFENAKKEIKKFSEQTTTDLDLKKVDDSKGVGEWLGDLFLGGGIGLNHKVTGEELNELTKQIQSHLHSINNTQIKLIKEFGQVYSALEALDKDCIQAILVSIKSTEETSQSIQKTQGQIKEIVEKQRKTLEHLEKFKRKLDGYAHIEDIDEIWELLSSTHVSLQNLGNELNLIKSSVSKHREDIDILRRFMEQLSKFEHLCGVDAIWDLTEKHQNRLDELRTTSELYAAELHELAKKDEGLIQLIDENKDRINNLNEYKEKFSSIVHLDDIDAIWRTVENHSELLPKLEKQSDEINNIIQINKNDATAAITAAIEQSNKAVDILTKKIKYAYLLAGGAIGLVFVELIVIFMKVI